MTCRKKKPVGGVSLFGGADIFGDLNKSPDTGGNSVLETSMENKNEVCTMCVYVRGVCVGVCVGGVCVWRGEGGRCCMYTCMWRGLVKGQLAGECGTKESNAAKKFVVKFSILE